MCLSVLFGFGSTRADLLISVFVDWKYETVLIISWDPAKQGVTDWFDNRQKNSGYPTPVYLMFSNVEAFQNAFTRPFYITLKLQQKLKSAI